MISDSTHNKLTNHLNKCSFFTQKYRRRWYGSCHNTFVSASIIYLQIWYLKWHFLSLWNKSNVIFTWLIYPWIVTHPKWTQLIISFQFHCETFNVTWWFVFTTDIDWLSSMNSLNWGAIEFWMSSYYWKRWQFSFTFEVILKVEIQFREFSHFEQYCIITRK